ncbi:MAG: hypothetical protein GY854_03965 [Deltaproteobacteria bacterium]|nr:hypothetical protein [Deltaproteobacteria bacterium]
MTLLTAIPLLASLLAATPGSSPETVDVAIDHMQIVFERKGSHVEVQQSLQLHSLKDDATQSVIEYQVMMPTDAFGPRQTDDEKTDLILKSDRFVVREPITKEGRRVSIRYNLPIRNGKVTLKQSLGGPIGTAQVMSTWTAGEAKLAGQGFSKSEQHQLSSGLNGLVIMTRDIRNGHVFITLSGLDSTVEWQAFITLALSIALLAGGLAIWIKDRLSSRGEDRTESAAKTV